jgi:hypothetical protein
MSRFGIVAEADLVVEVPLVEELRGAECGVKTCFLLHSTIRNPQSTIE